MRFVLALVVLAFSSEVAIADAWHVGPKGRRRVRHLVVVGIGAVYFTTEPILKDDLAPATCRSCRPTRLDTSLRDALRWNDTGLADSLGTYTAYVLAPVVGIGLTTIGGAELGSRIDGVLAVIESAALSGVLNQTVKFIVGRQRPFVRFGDPNRPAEIDDNLSFYSGHTTLAFSIATSAGIVAHLRKHRLEPVIWTAGFALAATTGYLRIAADRHYFTDVMVGAIVGSGLGLAVPLLFHKHLRDRAISVVPTGRGLSALGTF